MLPFKRRTLALAPFIAALACGASVASGAGCSSNSDGSNTSPVSGTSQASSVTSDVTKINTYAVQSQLGALLVNAKDATGNQLASFSVTKAPLINYAGGVLPVIVIEETGATGQSMHAEAASFYPLDRSDLSRTEFELFGVGNDNLIIRSAYDADNVLTRVSLFAYHYTGAPGATRLAKFMSNKMATAAPFDLPANYASLEDYVEGWINSTNLTGVFNSDELDNVYFTMRDPSWVSAIVNGVDPGTLATTTTQSLASALHFNNTGGGGTGGGGTGGGSGGSGSGSGSGTKSPSTPKPSKANQVSGCDTGSLGSFLSGILGSLAKDPATSISSAKACQTCAAGLVKSGTTGTDAGTTDAGAADAGADAGKGGTGTAVRPTKASAAKAQLVAAAKAVKTPKATASSSSACTQCEKLLQSTGVTKAATCLLGKATNGALGSKTGGSAQNTKGGSPADDMSDDCSSSSSSSSSDCADAPDGDTCTEGDDTCDMDPDDSTDDDGSFDLGSSDDDSNDSSDADDFDD